MEQTIYLQEVTLKPKAVPSMVPLAYDALMKLDAKMKQANGLTERQQSKLSVAEKYLLTIEEAAIYFGVGQKRLRRIVTENPNAEFLVSVGNRTLFKRKMFEEYIDNATTV